MYIRSLDLGWPGPLAFDQFSGRVLSVFIVSDFAWDTPNTSWLVHSQTKGGIKDTAGAESKTWELETGKMGAQWPCPELDTAKEGASNCGALCVSSPPATGKRQESRRPQTK